MSSTEEKTQEQAETPIAQPLSRTARLFGTAWAAVALLTIFTYWQQPAFLNLASSFRVQLLVLLALLSLPSTVLFKGPRRFLFLAVTLLISSTFLRYFIPSNAPSGVETAIAVANVYSGNRDLSRLKSWQQSRPVDILGVLEVSEHHVPLLRTFGLPHAVFEPRNSNFGVALLSKLPPLRSLVLDRETAFPSILVEYETYFVLLIHPVPPVSSEAREIGDGQVQRFAALLATLAKPCIVMGDINATDWDRRMEPLKEAGLRDCREGFGILSTWPTQRWWMRIPIDHVLVPEDWAVKACERGPDIGSDHYPLRAVVCAPSAD